MTLRAIRLWGKHIPDEKRADVVEHVLGLVKDADPTISLQASRVIVQMETNDIAAVTMLDKIARLDGGEDTERVGVHQVRVIVEEIRDERLPNAGG